jgi:hypothetical protein
VTIGMLALGVQATAAEDQRSYPYITGEVDIEVQNDGFYHPEDPRPSSTTLPPMPSPRSSST